MAKQKYSIRLEVEIIANIDENEDGEYDTDQVVKAVNKALGKNVNDWDITSVDPLE